jgi:predicted nucleic acid-binding protein
MKNLRIYLETSVISAVIDNREPEKNKYTCRFIEEIKKYKYEAFISRLTLLEIEKADNDTRKRLLKVIKEVNPEELLIDKDSEILAEKYLSEKIIPVKYENDAVHIAVASVNDLDVIAS